MIPCNDIGSTTVNATIGKGKGWMAEVNPAAQR
jgi:hypothetical protein